MPTFQFPSRGGRARFRWHPESRAVAVTSDGSSATYILEGKGLSLLKSVEIPGTSGALAAFDWDEDGEELYLLPSDSNTLGVVDFASFNTTRVDIAPFLGSCVYSDTEQIVVGTTKGALVVLDRNTKRKQVYLGRHTKRVLYVRIYNNVIFSIADDRSISLTRLTGDPIDQVVMRNDLAFVRLSKSGICAFVLGGFSIYTMDISKGLSSLREVALSNTAPVVGLDFMNDSTIVIAYAQGSVSLVDAMSVTLKENLSHKFARIESLVYSAGICCFLLGDQSITLWETSQVLTSGTIEKLTVPKDPKILSLSPDGLTAVISCASDFSSVHAILTVVPKVLASAGGTFARLVTLKDVFMWTDLVTGEDRPRKFELPFEPTALAVNTSGTLAAIDGICQVAVLRQPDFQVEMYRLTGVESVALNEFAAFANSQGRVFFVNLSQSSQSELLPLTEGDLIAAGSRTMVAIKGKLLRIFLGSREVKQYRHDSLITGIQLSSDGCRLALVDGNVDFFILSLPVFLANGVVPIIKAAGSLSHSTALTDIDTANNSGVSTLVKFIPQYPGEVVFSSAGSDFFAVFSKNSIEFFALVNGIVRKTGEVGVVEGSEVAMLTQETVIYSNKEKLRKETYSLTTQNLPEIANKAPFLSDEAVIEQLRSGTMSVVELRQVRPESRAILQLLLHAELVEAALAFVRSEKNSRHLHTVAVDRLVNFHKNFRAALLFVEEGSLEQAAVLAELGEEKKVKEIVSSKLKDEGVEKQVIALAQILERKKTLKVAAELYAMVGKYDRAVKLHLKDGDFDAANRYMTKLDGSKLWRTFARAKETRGFLKEAVAYYERAGDAEAVIRVLCSLGEAKKAVHLAKTVNLGFEYLAEYFAKTDQAALTVEFLLRCGKETAAFTEASTKNKLEVYDKVVDELGISSTDIFRKIATEYEKENPIKAAMAWTKAGDFGRGFNLAMKAKATELLIDILGQAKASGSAAVDALTPQLIAHISGESDGQAKHPKYAYSVYKALGHMESAARAVVMVAKQEAALGNYKDAHALLAKEFAGSQKISIEHWNLLTVLHSYFLIKRQAELDNHVTAALLVARVRKSLEIFPKHAAQILTTGVIETVKAGMRWEAYEYACELVKPAYKGLVPEAIKPKIELMVRKQKPTNEIPRFNEARSCCPFCNSAVNDSMLSCTECLEIIPFCVFTGLHINDRGIQACKSCGGLSREHQALGSCPLCGFEENWIDIIDRAKTLSQFKARVGKLSNYTLFCSLMRFYRLETKLYVNMNQNSSKSLATQIEERVRCTRQPARQAFARDAENVNHPREFNFISPGE